MGGGGGGGGGDGASTLTVAELEDAVLHAGAAVTPPFTISIDSTPVEVRSGDTVGSLKEKVAAAHPSFSPEWRLRFLGKALPDAQVVTSVAGLFPGCSFTADAPVVSKSLARTRFGGAVRAALAQRDALAPSRGILLEQLGHMQEVKRAKYEGMGKFLDEVTGVSGVEVYAVGDAPSGTRFVRLLASDAAAPAAAAPRRAGGDGAVDSSRQGAALAAQCRALETEVTGLRAEVGALQKGGQTLLLRAEDDERAAGALRARVGELEVLLEAREKDAVGLRAHVEKLAALLDGAEREQGGLRRSLQAAEQGHSVQLSRAHKASEALAACEAENKELRARAAAAASAQLPVAEGELAALAAELRAQLKKRGEFAQQQGAQIIAEREKAAAAAARAAEAAARASALEDAAMCTVCMARPRCMLTLPCKHLVTCGQCYVHVADKAAAGALPLCVLCQGEVLSCIQVAGAGC